VTRARPGRPLVAEVVGQLGGQATLQHRLDQRRQEPTLTGQLQPLLVDPGQQHIQPRPVDQLLSTRRDPVSPVSPVSLVVSGEAERLPAIDRLTPCRLSRNPLPGHVDRLGRLR